jgi:DNA cross-link repair 1A protein
MPRRIKQCAQCQKRFVLESTSTATKVKEKVQAPYLTFPSIKPVLQVVQQEAPFDIVSSLERCVKTTNESLQNFVPSNSNVPSKSTSTSTNRSSYNTSISNIKLKRSLVSTGTGIGTAVTVTTATEIETHTVTSNSSSSKVNNEDCPLNPNKKCKYLVDTISISNNTSLPSNENNDENQNNSTCTNVGLGNGNGMSYRISTSTNAISESLCRTCRALHMNLYHCSENDDSQLPSTITPTSQTLRSQHLTNSSKQQYLTIHTIVDPSANNINMNDDFDSDTNSNTCNDKLSEVRNGNLHGDLTSTSLLYLPSESKSNVDNNNSTIPTYTIDSDSDFDDCRIDIRPNTNTNTSALDHGNVRTNGISSKSCKLSNDEKCIVNSKRKLQMDLDEHDVLANDTKLQLNFNCIRTSNRSMSSSDPLSNAYSCHEDDSIVDYSTTDDEQEEQYNKPLATLFQYIGNNNFNTTSTNGIETFSTTKDNDADDACNNNCVATTIDLLGSSDESSIDGDNRSRSLVESMNKPLARIDDSGNTESFDKTMESQDRSEQIRKNNTTTSNNDLRMCFVCGKDLHAPIWKNRLQHIKSCAARHGVSMKDFRPNMTDEVDNSFDDYNTTISTPSPVTESGSVVQNTSTGNTASSLPIMSNPYNKKSMHMQSNWHGGTNGVTIGQQQNITADTTISSRTTDTSVPRRSLNDILMAGARKVASIANSVQQSKASITAKLFPVSSSDNTSSSITNPQSNGSGGYGGYNRFQQRRSGNYGTRSCPSYKKIPQTDFVCDGFQYANETVTKNYFLTHFHSDHYGGIDKSWRAGTIYCSIPTANLVNQQLGVDRQYIHPLPMYTPTIIGSKGKPVTVTLLNANHCPGAIMFLFEIGNRTILHVGDFRWDTSIMLSQHQLLPFCNGQRKLDDLFLDTTYCDARYDFPTQDECVQEAVKTAVIEWENGKKKNLKLLMVFGAYTIGKEAVYLAVAERLGMKIYVDPYRLRVLKALEWPSDKMSLFTTNLHETMLWVVPLGHINMKKIPTEYLAGDKRGKKYQFDKVIGFRPTGWSHTSGSKSKKGSTQGVETKKKPVLTSVSRGMITIHSVPYSEHSSFTELVECIQHLQPKRIIPTVAVSKSQEQIALLLRHASIEHNFIMS